VLVVWFGEMSTVGRVRHVANHGRCFSKASRKRQALTLQKAGTISGVLRSTAWLLPTPVATSELCARGRTESGGNLIGLCPLKNLNMIFMMNCPQQDRFALRKYCFMACSSHASVVHTIQYLLQMYAEVASRCPNVPAVPTQVKTGLDHDVGRRGHAEHTADRATDDFSESSMIWKGALAR
jgi:hypothetical protein